MLIKQDLVTITLTCVIVTVSNGPKKQNPTHILYLTHRYFHPDTYTQHPVISTSQTQLLIL